jgi:phosphoribosylformylglycinamidine synthase
MYGNDNTLGERVALSAGRSANAEDPSAITAALLGTPNIASKRWAFEQYDSVVGSRTAKRPESADAAVLMIPESERAIGVSIDGNGRRVACDPYEGAVEAVLECAQNLACVGAEPLGLTNCLNFGNPEKPGVAWQLDRAVSGLADACNALRVPVVGGNVSLYNETEHGPIYPTPVVGMVGELPDPAAPPGAALVDGAELVLVGPYAPSLAGSELVKLRGELAAGLPSTAIQPVAEALALVRELVRDGTASAAHDVSDGGLACAISEMAIAGGVGAEIDLDPLTELRGCSGETALFGEAPGGVLLCVAADALDDVTGRAEAAGVDCLRLGSAMGDRIEISAAEREVSLLLADAEAAWRSLPQQVERTS